MTGTSNISSRRVGRNSLVLMASLAILIAFAEPAWGASESALGTVGSGPAASVLTTSCPGNNYDSYFGEVGYSTASGSTYYNPPESGGVNLPAEINSAYNNFKSGHGIGVGAYYYVEPVGETAYPKTEEGAYEWGVYQGDIAVSYLNSANTTAGVVDEYTMNTIYADMESAGWYTGSNISLNQSLWGGFVEAVEGNDVNVGVYSSPTWWTDYIDQSVTVLEWTNHWSESDVTAKGDCPTSPFAQFSNGPAGGAIFFGGVTTASSVALQWQWVTAHAGDYDQTTIAHFNTEYGENRSS